MTEKFEIHKAHKMQETLAMGVRNCINTWEDENEEYII